MINEEKFLAVGEKEAELQTKLIEEAKELQTTNYAFTLKKINEEQGK